MILPALYHWSPADYQVSILQDGLKIYSEPCVSSYGRYPYLCLSPDPAAAWSLSGDMEWTSEIEEWDLWQVQLNRTDEVHIRAEFGNEIVEVRVKNSIGPDRVWWVARREPLCAIVDSEDGFVAATSPIESS